MTEFLAGYSGILDAASLVFVVVSLAGFALTASFSRASLTIVVDLVLILRHPDSMNLNT